MGGDDAPYIAKKLRADHVALNVDGRKKPHSARYLLTETPKRLESGFVELAAGNSAASRKRKPDTSDDDNPAEAANRPSTRRGAQRAAADGRPLSSAALLDVVHPFTEKKRGRPKKSKSDDAGTSAPGQSEAPASLATAVPAAGRSVRSDIARPTPSPDTSAGGDDAAPREDVGAAVAVPRVSSTDRGTRRLLPNDVLQLQVGDEVALVIPYDRPGESKDAAVRRATVKAAVKRHVRQNLTAMQGVSADERELQFDNIVREGHLVQREGRQYCEFAATVTNFAHREDYATWPETVVDTVISQGGAIAMRFDICDMQRGPAFELKLQNLSAVEIWKRRDPLDGTTSHIQFSQGLRNVETLEKELPPLLSMADGDTQLTYEVLYKFYREKATVVGDGLRRAKKKAATNAAKAGDKAEQMQLDEWKQILKDEMKNDRVGDFCDEADAVWQEAITQHYTSFHKITDELISEATYVKWYDTMAKWFPHHAAALLNIACNQFFFQSSRINEEQLSLKKKTALVHFFALCRARNPEHMTHWAMVETLAVFGKGISQVTTRSVAGKSFCTTLRFALEKLDKIYDKCKPEIQAVLRSEPTTSYVLDNYQKLFPKLTQTDESSAISHRATAALAMRHKVPAPPIGSILRSPSGHQFEIAGVQRASPYTLFFVLQPTEMSPDTDMPEDEQKLVYNEDGTTVSNFVYPSENPRWSLVEVPGLDEAGPRTYLDQHVPSMLELKVPNDATDAQLLLESRDIDDRYHEDKALLEARRHQRLVHQQERITELSTFCDQSRKDDKVKRIVQYIEHEKGRGDSERFDYEATPAEDMFAEMQYELKAATLVDSMRASSKPVYRAKTYQSEMIRRANPEVGVADQFYVFPLHDGDETTNEGALRALINAHVEMGLLEEIVVRRGDTEQKHYRFKGDDRFISIFGDQLTEARIHPVKGYVTKSLTKIGYEDYVEQLVSAIDQQLMQHDYLHETFHMLEAIYRQYWGGFLQPLSVALGQKRVTGEPLRSGAKIIDHHLNLELVYDATCQFRCEMFVQKLQRDDVRIADDESPADFVLRIDGLYEAYCNEAFASENEQTLMLACFMKKVASYMRCKKAIRVADVLLLECETCDWLGMWKDCGKTGYLRATIRRIENYYYNTKPWLLECNRRNRLPLMTEGKGHMAFDEVCELLMSWLKRLPATTFLSSVIKKSRHISLIRRCALELWGKRRLCKSSSLSGRENEKKRLLDILRASRAYEDSNDAVKMEEKTFWALVHMKKAFEPSGKDRRRETVEMNAHERQLIEALAGEEDLDGVDAGEFERLLRGDGGGGDDEESVNGDDDNVAVDCEGTFDEENPPAEEDEEETMCLESDANRDSILRKLGNSAHKPLNKQAMLDSFARAHVTLKDVKEDRDKELAKEKRQRERIETAVACFVRERNKRRRVLKEQIRKEKEDSDDEMEDWEASYLQDREEHG